ncbi:ABC transporter permease [Cytophagaceae bacterium ABcell3]|nr:ABC transporter permease [Cytophagaceae bacterium ABcell3]
MNKIFHIILREYLTRIRKRSFIVMTLLGPLFFALLLIVPVWLNMATHEPKAVTVLDHSFLFTQKLRSTELLRFTYASGSLSEAKEAFAANDADMLLYIPPFSYQEDVNAELFAKSQTSPQDYEEISAIMGDVLLQHALTRHGLPKDYIAQVQNKISIATTDITDEFEGIHDLRAFSTAGLVSAILIYFFIFLYGVQVMRGVIEEKTNRIIEVIISSVKPFQLMMGKIIGIALLSITQFIIWLTLTAGVTTFIATRYQLDRFADENIHETLRTTTDIQQALEVNEVLNLIASVDFGTLLLTFAFYFLGGYLLYSALFAAIGSLADSETDTQQFMLPVTIPLIFSFVMAATVTENPHSPVAQWLSMIPFTSPIIMMVRIPFGVPWQELALSIAILCITFLIVTWLAARIYRVGILFYGKKASFKDAAKWLFSNS